MKLNAKKIASATLSLALLAGYVPTSDVFAATTANRSIKIKTIYNNGGHKELKGSVWEIYKIGELQDDGTYRTIPAQKVKTITVDGVKNGEETKVDEVLLYNAKTSNTEGRYRVKQVKRPDGFLLNNFGDNDAIIEFPKPNTSNGEVTFKLGDAAIDEVWEIHPKMTPVSLNKEVKIITSDASKVPDGSIFNITRQNTVNAGSHNYDNLNYNTGSTVVGNLTKRVTSSSGKIVLSDLREGTYRITMESAPSAYLKRTVDATIVVGMNSDITNTPNTGKANSKFKAYWKTPSKFVLDNGNNIPSNKEMLSTDKLVLGIKPVPGATPGTNTDLSFSKRVTEKSGTNVSGKTNLNTYKLRKGDTLKYKISVNMPDNIREYRKFAIVDKLGDALEWADMSVAANNVNSTKKDQFDFSFSSTKELIASVKQTSLQNGTIGTGVVELEVSVKVKSNAVSQAEVVNNYGIAYDDGNGNTSGYAGDNVKPQNELEFKSNTKDTGNQGGVPHVTDINQLTIITHTPKSDGTSQINEASPTANTSIKFTLTGESVTGSNSGEKNAKHIYNNMKDGIYTVDNTKVQSPVRAFKKFTVEIKDGEPIKVENTAINTDNQKIKGYLKYDRVRNTLHVYTVNTNIVTPATGTFTIYPMITVTLLFLGLGIRSRREESKKKVRGK